MHITESKLKEALVQSGLIAEADFNLAVKEAGEQNKELASLLVEKDLIRDSQLGQLIANEINIPYVNLQQEKIDEQVLNLIPELVARKKGIIAFARDSEGIKVGMNNPQDLEIIHLLEKQFGDKVMPFYASERDLADSLTLYRISLQEEFSKVLAEINDKKKTKEEHDSMFIKLVDLLLEYGYQNKASDIHIEPYARKVQVRFRIDGIMHDVLEVPKSLSEFIIARIKILAKMRTDEHRSAQDGKLSFKSGENKIDVRVSIVPVTQGENLVLRILSDKNRKFSLNDLGIGDNDLVKINKAIKNPHGMILVTGPTGSGKTTTLYAVLKILNKREVHIATIEDPVEYDIEGVSQIQVDTKTNLTFAKGLRAIVRQDPDIIMVGEIRDKETAKIALEAAITGHLVLATIHTNNAAGAIVRLINMGIEPFLLSTALKFVSAQRLARHNCPNCKKEYDPPKELIRTLGAPEGIKFYHSEGCDKCNGKGMKGRRGIHELLSITKGIQDLILLKPTDEQINELAIKEGMMTLREAALQKVYKGEISIEEAIRLTE